METEYVVQVSFFQQTSDSRQTFMSFVAGWEESKVLSSSPQSSSKFFVSLSPQSFHSSPFDVSSFLQNDSWQVLSLSLLFTHKFHSFPFCYFTIEVQQLLVSCRRVSISLPLFSPFSPLLSNRINACESSPYLYSFSFIPCQLCEGTRKTEVVEKPRNFLTEEEPKERRIGKEIRIEPRKPNPSSISRLPLNGRRSEEKDQDWKLEWNGAPLFEWEKNSKAKREEPNFSSSNIHSFFSET